ncbi:MFS transporter [Macrococcus epidermidis]|uniref:MFS transporter n=1 Tax=Macrococcus epidermidis TaxID=1902580 RepID=A0A327ZMD1_9STAP|nr:MFS transporter [Macrococcus epidermidis]RAK43605.1 MFS transporter [Macrococcus epidermidis]UTH16685.1 MFS transporter [Macrococcus epidermidis]
MKKGLISALVIIMFMSAIETSIISLATPAIGKDLNATKSLALIFTTYMIAIVIVTPIVGELMKRLGAKRLMLLGIIVFIIGSMLSGLSFTFEMLLASRLVQGLGAGIMMTMGNIIPKIAFEIPYRYKVMGIVGSVWGISSIVGPILGGLILTYLNWSYLFYVNVPLAFLAIFLVIKYFKFEEMKQESKFDFKGLIYFYIFLGSLLCALLIETHWFIHAALFILAMMILIIFIKYESRIDEPFIPVKAFNKRIGIVMGTDMLYAIIMMGTNIFLPIYLQTEKGLSPLLAGLTTFTISIFWLLSTFVLKTLETKLTIQRVYQLSFLYMIIGSLIIFIFDHAIAVTIASAFLGLSFGTVFTKNIVTIQESAAPHQLGSMMSTYSLLKFIGSTTGSIIMSFFYYSNVFTTIDNNMAFGILVASFLIIIYQFVFKNKVVH